MNETARSDCCSSGAWIARTHQATANAMTSTPAAATIALKLDKATFGSWLRRAAGEATTIEPIVPQFRLRPPHIPLWAVPLRVSLCQFQAV